MRRRRRRNGKRRAAETIHPTMTPTIVDPKRRADATIHPTMTTPRRLGVKWRVDATIHRMITTTRRVDAKRRANATIHWMICLMICRITTRRFRTRRKATALEVVVALAIMINLGRRKMINLGRGGGLCLSSCSTSSNKRPIPPDCYVIWNEGLVCCGWWHRNRRIDFLSDGGHSCLPRKLFMCLHSPPIP